MILYAFTLGSSRLLRAMRPRCFAFVALLLMAAYLAGIATARFRLPPYTWLAAAKQSPTPIGKNGWAEGEEEYLRFLFVDPLPEKTPLILPPVKSLAELNRVLRSWMVDPGWIMMERTYPSPNKAETKDGLFKVAYSLQEDSDAYAFYLQSEIDRPSGCAILIIPGTGNNHATEMLHGEIRNYQRNIVPIARRLCDVYIYIRPNDGPLAVHDGRGKLSHEGFVVYLLNQGGSYTARYFADIAAIGFQLKNTYKRLAIVGLSQGGYATLATSLVIKPDAAVVASGYSILNDVVEWASIQQVILPGIGQFLASGVLYAKLAQRSTRYLFSYGRKETGTYGIEARDGMTCSRFANNPNVQCVVHSGGHEYPLAHVQEFLVGALR